jgi:hypothetical protein
MALPFEYLIYLANQLGLSVDELLKTNVTVGTQTGLTTREIPGIVSVVTRDQIQQTVKSQLPYNTEDVDWYYRKRFMRYNGQLKYDYNPVEKLNLIAGLDYYYDIAADRDTAIEATFYNGDKSIINRLVYVILPSA